MLRKPIYLNLRLYDTLLGCFSKTKGDKMNCPKCNSSDCGWEKGLSELIFAYCRECGYKTWDIEKFGLIIQSSEQKVSE